MHRQSSSRRLSGWLVLVAAMILVGCSAGELPTIVVRATDTPTATASPTSTSTPTPTLTATPTPTPTPTPMPAAALSTADDAAFIGDWQVAIATYQDVILRSDVDPDQKTAAVQGLAEVYLSEGAHDEVVALLSPAASADEDAASSREATSTLEPETALLLADALRMAGHPISATQYYSQVLQVKPELSLYVDEWLGDAYLAAGAPLTATQAYSRALPEAETASERVWLLEKIALAEANAGNYDGAMASYDAILDIARIPAYRAKIMYRAADTALSFGESDEAYLRMIDLATAYPKAEEAYEAMVKLVAAGQPIDQMTRGMVDYYAEAYGPAVQAFYRVILEDPEHTGAPHYYAGLSFLEAGSPQLALDEFELLIETHPDDPLVPSAWIGKGRAQSDLGNKDLAFESYRVVTEVFSATTQAADALWEASERFEETGEFAPAADLLLMFADRYPDDDRAPQARFQAGLLWYQASEIDEAEAAWRSQVTWYPYDEQAQASWYWLGKTYLATGQTLSATEALSQAVGLGAWDFYGLQAGDLLDGTPPFPQNAEVAVACDTSQAQSEAETWLAAWLDLAPEVEVGALPAEISNDVRLQRAEFLLEVGHFAEARLELEKLRLANVDDALAQYQLALTFRDLGVYRSSISAASALWRLSPAEDIAALPRFIGCLIYPTYYSQLVEPAAAAEDLPPLLVYALLRQESLFEGQATSFAAARGLMQVIPPTGDAIAAALGWPPGYETSDLYRPMVSVRFGTWYLAEQRDYIDGNLYAAMAAYNGGPGNSRRWWDQAEGDPDLFVELIAFSETRRYVRLIREHFAAYEWLYTRAGAP